MGQPGAAANTYSHTLPATSMSLLLIAAKLPRPAVKNVSATSLDRCEIYTISVQPHTTSTTATLTSTASTKSTFPHFLSAL